MTNSSNRSSGRSKSPLLVNFLYMVVWGVLIWACWNNILPYAHSAQHLFGAGREGTAASQSNWMLGLLSKLPIIGGIFGLFRNAGTWLLGALIWALLQIAQILPVVLFHSPRTMRNIIQRDSQHPRFTINQGDGFALNVVKRAYNILPVKIVQKIMYFQLGAYVAEFIVNTAYYPIVKGDLFGVLMTGRYHKINLVAVGSILLTMFLVEGLVWLLITVEEIKQAYRGAPVDSGSSSSQNNSQRSASAE